MICSRAERNGDHQMTLDWRSRLRLTTLPPTGGSTALAGPDRDSSPFTLAALHAISTTTQLTNTSPPDARTRTQLTVASSHLLLLYFSARNHHRRYTNIYFDPAGAEHRESEVWRSRFIRVAAPKTNCACDSPRHCGSRT